MQIVSRLIQQFIPTHYQLSLSLNRAQRTFEGTVTINGSALGDVIPLHAKDLTISSVTVNGKEAMWTQGDNDELTITPAEKADRAIVVIAYEGSISDAMHGLYPCYYEHDGVKKELLATQFESHHAREVFPCVDEPEAKSTFDVTLTTETGLTVLGNMPVLSQKEEGGKLVTKFDTTPRMSTYLLAWVVGELHKKTAVTKSGVEVNVWATPAQKPESLDFALDIARRTIDFFDDYFGIPYPLPKSDHVALPDFSSGAMENWGLITYREIALLADPATTSISGKHYIATVVAHELSHQWFGNLVTMKWWNNLWLNESFATLMEYIAVDALHPEWDIWLDFATYESIMALRRDSIDGVQAVQVDVNHPDEISTLFDGAIVYAKGARLLRMLQQYIGHEDFQKGLKTYFQRHAYSNTEADDLWTALSEASGKDISTFMNTWISQGGYPVLHAVRSGSSLKLTQEQFFVGPHEESSKLWPIPLNASENSLPDLFDARELELSLTNDEPVRFNTGDSAHFITHYDHETLKGLLEMVRTGSLKPLDRLQLLHEQSLLARGGQMESAELITILDAYKHEATESVWDIISLCIGELKKFVFDNPESERYLRLMSAEIAREQYNRLGWSKKENEPETDTKMRATIIGLMLYGEDADTITKAIDLFRRHPIEKLDPELRSLIIGATVRHGHDETIFTKLIEDYKNTSSADLQQDIASGLTSTKDPRQIQRLLDLLQDESIIRHQDVTRWFVWILRNKDGRILAWQWLQKYWDWIVKTFGGDKSYDDYPRYAANSLLTRQELEDYKIFFSPKQNEPALARAITMGIKDIEGRVDLIERDRDAVRKALTASQPLN